MTDLLQGVTLLILGVSQIFTAIAYRNLSKAFTMHLVLSHNR